MHEPLCTKVVMLLPVQIIVDDLSYVTGFQDHLGYDLWINKFRPSLSACMGLNL